MKLDQIYSMYDDRGRYNSIRGAYFNRLLLFVITGDDGIAIRPPLEMKEHVQEVKGVDEKVRSWLLSKINIWIMDL